MADRAQLSAVCGGVMAALLMLSGIGASAAADHTARTSFVARHQFEAEVSEVDRAVDVLRLKTEAGRLTLRAPDAAAPALRKGDRVVVDVAVIRHPDPAALSRRQEDPPPLLTQRLRASIISIQRTVGVVALNTPAGRLTLDLPSAAVAGLRTGDPLVLELAVRLEQDVAALPAKDTPGRKSGLAALLFMLFGRPK